ncbi:Lrp/AsnC family transcriptional regulator [Devosia aquimaris]|uniref:Lrp/AsnC family transcriptional regulator n=1 Tax=Devosia aquimaris TaxID=2866214 RepID=UPI001CD18EB4|nr:Lrp/AsnC family transcriptional regulator [Devosia sp. CJK-A8-3]
MDRIDSAIVAQLRRDGRISNAQLATAVGLSPSACLRRLRTLEETGVIRGYTAIVDSPTPEAAIIAIVQITLERQTDDVLRRFEQALRGCAEVRECYLMAGLTDYLVRVEAASVADYERLHTEVLSRLPSVTRIQSSFAIRNVLRPARG